MADAAGGEKPKVKKKKPKGKKVDLPPELLAAFGPTAALVLGVPLADVPERETIRLLRTMVESGETCKSNLSKMRSLSYTSQSFLSKYSVTLNVYTGCLLLRTSQICTER